MLLGQNVRQICARTVKMLVRRNLLIILPLGVFLLYRDVSYKQLYSPTCTNLKLTGSLSRRGILVHESMHILHFLLRDFPHPPPPHWASEALLSDVLGRIFLDISKPLCVCHTFENFPLCHMLHDFNIFINLANNNFGCKSSIKM